MSLIIRAVLYVLRPRSLQALVIPNEKTMQGKRCRLLSRVIMQCFRSLLSEVPRCKPRKNLHVQSWMHCRILVSTYADLDLFAIHQ